MSREIEIIITNPPLNTDPNADFSYRERGFGEHLRKLVREGILNPARYKKVVDLFAGFGSGAKVLIDEGFDEWAITCIDRASPGENILVSGVTFQTWNLENLGEAIFQNQNLPKDVLAHRGQYDLALLLLPSTGSVLFPEIAAFFCKIGRSVGKNWQWNPL